MEPWIKLYRKFINWEWYKDINCKVVFLHLLLTANWKPVKWKGITLDVGEVVIGRKKLSETLMISEQEIRTALDKLERSQVISRKSTNRYTVAKILNYGNYQGEYVCNQQTTSGATNRATNRKEEENPLINSVCKHSNIDNQPTEQPTNNQQSNQQATTDKELKNNRNIYNNYIYYSESFGDVIKAYENNIGIVTPTAADILKGFTDEFDAELILFAIEEAVKSNVRNIRYIEGILRTWKEKGVSSVEGAKLATVEHRTKSAAMPKPGGGRAEPKKNFFQDYDPDDISEFELQLIRQRMHREEIEEEKEILKQMQKQCEE